MTEKPPDKKVQKMLVTNYETACELLEYRLCEVFKILVTQDDIVGHNSVIHDIKNMLGEAMKTDLIEKVANDVIVVGKAEVAKDK